MKRLPRRFLSSFFFPEKKERRGRKEGNGKNFLEAKEWGKKRDETSPLYAKKPLFLFFLSLVRFVHSLDEDCKSCSCDEREDSRGFFEKEAGEFFPPGKYYILEKVKNCWSVSFGKRTERRFMKLSLALTRKGVEGRGIGKKMVKRVERVERVARHLAISKHNVES